MENNFRAPDANKSISKEKAYKDTRRMGETLKEDLPKWDTALIIVFVLGAAPFYYPVFNFLSIPLITIIAFWSGSSRTNRRLPMKLPLELKKQKDYNDPVPGNRHKFNKAGGTIMLGNLRKGKTELWLTGKDLLTHMLLIGTTGAGKTETLISISASTAFCMGGGMIYVDAKAAPKLLFQFFSLARMFGREDDVRTVNYLTGNRTIKQRNWERLSNTTNPFAQGTATTASQTLTGLLPAGGGDNQYFLDRAIAILNTLMPALVELRDKGILNIYPSLLGEYISLSKFMDLSRNHIEVNGIHYQNVQLSDRVLKPIQGFLKALPGFNPKLEPAKQPEQVATQFGFAEGYFSRTLASLAGIYGHIYETELGEADFSDIVMNNRILVVLVPAMEQAGEERAALGKVVLSSIRVAMGQGLGGRGEGDREDVLDSLPVDLKIPTVIIVDEYAEVAVEGFAVTATQGRGLGMSVIFAGQDLAGFIRASKEEADMIFGNTRLKVLMALEDPEITWDRFKKLASTMKVAQSAGWEKNSDGLSTYKTNLSANISEADRISFLDLKEQREGEAHVFDAANIHKAQIFHHGISDKKLVNNFRINRMLKIKNPNPDVVEVLQKKVLRNAVFERRLSQRDDIALPNVPALDRIAGINAYLNDDAWPWRFLATLEKTKEEHSSLNSNLILKNQGNKDSPSDLSKSIESLNDANDASVPGDDSYGSDFDGMNMDEMMGTDSIPSADATSTVLNEINEPTTSAADKGADTDSDLSVRINNSLARAENHWVFKTATHDGQLSRIRKVFETMVEINTQSGLDDSKARAAVINSIEGVTEAVVYPSQPIKAKPEDIDDLWGALQSLGEEEKSTS